MNNLEKKLLDDFQRDFPLTPTPYADIAQRLNVDEGTVLAEFSRLASEGTLSRIGAVVKTGTVGASTLAALAVPEDRLEEVADLVSAYVEVNHNYEREHAYNLWFVVTAGDQDKIKAVIEDIERRTGLSALNLPMIEDYHLDLGFKLQWN
ncbi:MAG: Lrp/AsnC family transcriptional regulator [Rhodospirillales bacterium]|nr:Lrp/AsnC family transcriptional regulator [Rhodospirillales bacterium]